MALSLQSNQCKPFLVFMFAWAITLFFIKNVSCQTFPAKNDSLNFTSVCFTFPWESTASTHTLVLVGNGKRVESSSAANKIILHGLQQKSSYKWTVLYKDAQNNTVKTLDTSSFYIVPYNGDVRYRFITNDSAKRTNDILICDYAYSAINRNGKLVWFLPGIKQTTGIRDLKMTDDGTFTAIIDSSAVELDLKGNVIWRAPDNGEISGLRRENYHHHFQKLSNGNYLVLGSEFKKYKFDKAPDSVEVEMGTIIEYTPDKKITWVWRSADFFKPEWIPLLAKDERFSAKVHMNAVNMANGFVYAGFRDVGWIVKLEKATQKVVAIYGGNDSRLPIHYGKKMFRFQHDVLLLRDGSIGVLNNDSVDDPNVVSSIILFKENQPYGAIKTFEFPFNYDNNSNGKSMKLGNLLELPNGNLLVNMGGINRIIEVTRDKKIVWDVFIEKYDSFKKVWRFFPQYRVSSSSSLYPNEFSVKLEKAANKACYYFITNVGSESNSFTFFIEKNGKKIKIGQTKILNAGESVRAVLSIPAELRAQKNIPVLIQVNGRSKQEKLIFTN